jgi:hypothetical protein
MKFTSHYQNGGKNPMWEAYEIIARCSEAKGLTILGRTDGRDGCRVRLLDENQKEMWSERYDFKFDGLSYFLTMARELAWHINFLFELGDCPKRIDSEELESITALIRDMTERRYGNELPDSDYEVRVTFE